MTDIGEVRLAKAGAQDAEDPVLAPFLALLDKRLEARPNLVVLYSDADANQDIALIKGVKAG